MSAWEGACQLGGGGIWAGAAGPVLRGPGRQPGRSVAAGRMCVHAGPRSFRNVGSHVPPPCPRASSPVSSFLVPRVLVPRPPCPRASSPVSSSPAPLPCGCCGALPCLCAVRPVHTHTRTHTHTHTHALPCLCAVRPVHTHTRTHAHTHMRTRTHARTHTPAPVSLCNASSPHKHTHTHARSRDSAQGVQSALHPARAAASSGPSPGVRAWSRAVLSQRVHARRLGTFSFKLLRRMITMCYAAHDNNIIMQRIIIIVLCSNKIIIMQRIMISLSCSE
jgi:hypothetical protein